MQQISQGFECEVDDNDWLSVEVEVADLTIAMISGDQTVSGITLGPGQVLNLIEFLSGQALPALLEASPNCAENSLGQERIILTPEEMLEALSLYLAARHPGVQSVSDFTFEDTYGDGWCFSSSATSRVIVAAIARSADR